MTSIKRISRRGLVLCLLVALMFSMLTVPAYAKEKSYYEITEGTSDERYNIILLGGGGDNKVFVNGEDFGKVNVQNIISACVEGKINVLAGHSTGANQVELFIRDGTLEDYIDVYCIVDGQAYVNEVRYCNGDTAHPVLIFMSDQMNRINLYTMSLQYTNYKGFRMHGCKHVNIATEHFDEVVDLIHEYCEAYGIEPGVIPEEKHTEIVEVPRDIDITVNVTFSDAQAKIPECIPVTLYSDGKLIAVQEIVPDENGVWTCTFEQLPRYTDGVKVEYRVGENIDGFEPEITSTVIEYTGLVFDIDNQNA